MDAKLREDFIQLFNQGFEEVVLPQLEEIREDIHEIKGEVREIKGEIQDMKGEIQDMKGEIQEIRTIVNEHSDKLDALTLEVSDLKQEFRVSRDKTASDIEKIKDFINFPQN